MLPYSANDLLNTMRYEMTPEAERRHGNQIARDIPHDNDRDDTNGPRKGFRESLRLLFLHAPAVTVRGS
jgi:hypothetical protein